MSKKNESALIVNEGVKQPPTVNPYIQNFYKNKGSVLTPKEYLKGIFAGDRSMLGRAITLIESNKPEHRIIAKEIIKACQEKIQKSKIRTMRIGITGVPGAGKSTFIEAFGGLVTSGGHKLAVLAIDPSSEKTGGSILGDKTRMETLTKDPKAFIRPSPSAGSLGGVSRKTRESVILCEAAGYDVVFIETVGVGQSETAVHSMSDFFLLLMLSGAGDDLQGIKRGIMEMSDLIAITKADGSNIEKAMGAKAQYASALHLFPPADSGWTPTAVTSSAVTKEGLPEIWEIINNYFKLVQKNGYYDYKRRQQSKYWMYETINETLKSEFYDNPKLEKAIQKTERQVLAGQVDSFMAAEGLIELFQKER